MALKQDLPEIKTSSIRKTCTCLIEDQYREWFAGQTTIISNIDSAAQEATSKAKLAMAKYYQQVSPREGTSNVELSGLRYEVFMTPYNTIRRAWILSDAKLRS